MGGPPGGKALFRVGGRTLLDRVFGQFEDAGIRYVAIAIELAFSTACGWWYQFSEKKLGRPMPRKQLVALYAVFIIGVGAAIPAATLSVRELLA